MASKFATKEKLLTEIKDRLKCPLCFDLPANNIFQCGTCGYSVCQECYEQIRLRPRTINGETRLVRMCPQNCRAPLSVDKPIPNLVWNQLAELFRNNSRLVNNSPGFLDISSPYHFLNKGIQIKYGALVLLYAIAAFFIPLFMERMYSPSNLKTWNATFVDEEAKEYFWAQRDHCKMNNCDLTSFINTVKNMEVTATHSKTDLEWLRSGSLFLSAQYGSLESVFYILEETHLDPNIMDEDGINPIHFAMLDDDERRGNRKEKVLQVLGAYRWISTFSSALHAAAKWGNPDKVRTLLEGKTNPNALDVFGLTPLFLAMKNKNEEMGVKIVEELLKNGANCSVTNRDRTADPLDIARQFRSVEFLRQVEALYRKYQPECLEANFRRHEKLLNQLKQLGLREELSVFYYGERTDEPKVTHKSEVECKNENSGVCLAP